MSRPRAARGIRGGGWSGRWRIAAAVMGALFVISAVVQWNDPDPLIWIVLYAAAAVLAFAGARNRLPLAPNLGALAVFGVLTALWLPSLFDARKEAFTSFQMRSAGDEEARETGGLALCTGWLGIQSYAAWRRRRA